MDILISTETDHIEVAIIAIDETLLSTADDGRSFFSAEEVQNILLDLRRTLTSP